ncbi:DNA-3-methyladenine glycosylase I [Heterostelium album PN500]|uniref:DNA-3-methyladenine glycosylase I n=1 Tax=Heterostelium pallidum (strain ATCC 26659 / Pp 5 / PN500) TaxID=670386 RepID=D3BBY0_HETP5|nr:DNA-3-methyladenine glycosylase I [Heterostelium album PN500]EFA81163.1 DNA-3-methyladenine glycosylase I [Heterostelium album PN500]|eukprot:XP_020433281.1 DNA-3-methyladenine glycosylase I [Heterostelium album PN500]
MSVSKTIGSIASKSSATQQLVRCGWVTSDPLYLEYHDHEWGIPNRDRRHLFEMICLEGQQAGLSWITILKKRAAYKSSFHNFDVDKVANMTDEDINKLLSLTNSSIIRHRGKLEAIVHNAKMVKAMEKKGENLSDFFWSFSPNNNSNSKIKSTKVEEVDDEEDEEVDESVSKRKGKAKATESKQSTTKYFNSYDSLSEVPATTTESDLMSKELKKRGFKFVGSTTCYAFIQACGLVNDHISGCFCYAPIKNNVAAVETTSQAIAKQEDTLKIEDTEEEVSDDETSTTTTTSSKKRKNTKNTNIKSQSTTTTKKNKSK